MTETLRDSLPQCSLFRSRPPQASAVPGKDSPDPLHAFAPVHACVRAAVSLR